MTSTVFSGMPQYQFSKGITQATSEPLTVKDALPSSNIMNLPTTQTNKDSIELSETKKKKKGPIRRIKEFIANIKKTIATSEEYVKGFARGIGKGSVMAAFLYTGSNMINYVRNHSGKENVKQIPSRALAITGLVISLGASLWNASLNATERNSQIDHRWNGHKNL